MTTATLTQTFEPLGRIFAAPFLAIGRGMVYLMENNSRVRELEFLSSLSDEELAKRNLRRDEILEHVFRGYMHL